MDEIFKKRSVNVLYLCNKQDSYCSANEFCGGEYCNHTALLLYSKNRERYFDGTISNFLKFLNEHCESYVNDDKVIFMEVEEVPEAYGECKG